MKNKIVIVILLLSVFSCVSKKKFTALENRYADLKKDEQQLQSEFDALQEEKDNCDQNLSDMQTEFDALIEEHNVLDKNLDTSKEKISNLKDSFNELAEKSSEEIARNTEKNKELLSQLEDRENKIAEEQARLGELVQEMDKRSQKITDLEKEIKSEKERLLELENALQEREKITNDLDVKLSERSKRIAELESALAKKDSVMNSLKESVSKALTSFEGKGLTVEKRNGKVYVSMENKLLFDSGSWIVGTEGKKAVLELGKVLAENPEIDVLIEGHTDNDPFGSKGELKGNWDLSTKRATAIVTLLMQNKDLKPENLTAAGRSEFVPIAKNDSAENKAKNRRIEVILTPKLDKVTQLLKEVK